MPAHSRHATGCGLTCPKQTARGVPSHGVSGASTLFRAVKDRLRAAAAPGRALRHVDARAHAAGTPPGRSRVFSSCDSLQWALNWRLHHIRTHAACRMRMPRDLTSIKVQARPDAAHRPPGSRAALPHALHMPLMQRKAWKPGRPSISGMAQVRSRPRRARHRSKARGAFRKPVIRGAA